MKEIQLTQGKVALVSEQDFERVSQYKWYAAKKYGGGFVAQREENKRTLLMHRFIMDATDPNTEVDHWNLNRLDNTRENLRICTHEENSANRRKRKDSKHSQYKGVFKQRGSSTWRAEVKDIYIGSYPKEEDAARAYNRKAIELFGEFAHLNIVL